MGKVITEDTRNKPSKHDLKRLHFSNAGYKVIRSKLYVGDYMLVGGSVCVDTKASVQEVHSNITTQHERFKRECVKAADAGYELWVLVENRHGIRKLADLAEWVESDEEFRRRCPAKVRIDGARLARAMATMYRRYGVCWAFSSPEDAGRKVIEILEGGGLNGDG